MIPSRALLSALCICSIAAVPLLGHAEETATAQKEVESQSGNPIAAATFFRNPAISQPRLSPDGRNIAFVVSKNDLQRVFVRKVVGTETIGLAEFELGQVRLRWLDWANSSRVILSADAPDSKEVGVQPLVTRIYGVTVNLKRPRLKWLGESWWPRGPDWPTTQARFRDRVINMLRSDTDSVLLSHVEFGERTPSVSKLNVISGRLRKLEGARSGVEGWYADDDGLIRAAEVVGASANRKSYSLLARVDGSQDFAAVLETADRDAAGYEFAGFHESPGRLYVLADHQGRRAVFLLDVATGTLGEPVFASDRYDAASLYLDEASGRYVGTAYLADGPEIEFFDDAFAKQQASIDYSLRASQGKKTTNRIVSATRDGNLVLIESSSDVQPPVYYALNREQKTMNFVFDQRPDLPIDALQSVAPISIPVRDGATLPGYLTRPKGELASKAAPMVVMLHGGFGDRAWLRYDPAVQFFASRGYVVLQVNHRGSGGYGRAFELAGMSEVDAMAVVQADLADAVAWAVAQGIADAGRVAVMGADGSGGIAIRAAVASPNVFGAVASHGGEVDPLVKWLDDLDAPVLLAHGSRNTDVPIGIARQLVERLNAVGGIVESVEYEEETTGFALERNRVDYHERVLAFFDEHLSAEASSSERDVDGE